MAKEKERSQFISHLRKLMGCEHKNSCLSQIVGPTAAGSARPVPMPLCPGWYLKQLCYQLNFFTATFFYCI